MGGGRVAGLMGSSTGETTDIGVSGNSAGAALVPSISKVFSGGLMGYSDSG